MWEASPVGMLLCDAEGRIRIVNRKVEEIFGYRREELVGQRVEMLVPERFRAMHPASRAGFVARPTARSMGAGRDLYGLRKDGTEVPVEIGLDSIALGQGATVTSIVDITRRKALEEGLQQTLAEKETLFRELHHRVKNNLQVVASLLGLQGRYAKDPTAAAVLAEAHGRVHAIALVHEMLYQSETLTRVDFSAYLRTLADQVSRASGRADVRLWLDLDGSVTLPVDQAIPCGLVVHELVANALEHAFPDGRTGTVTVALRRAESDGDGAVEIVVEDDGIGLPEGLQNNRGGTMGFRLVDTLTRQVEGRLTVDASSGTRVRLRVEVR